MENKLTLSEYRMLQDFVNQKLFFYSKMEDELSHNENRTKKMRELLTVAQKIDFICHDIMQSEVKING